MTEVLGVAGLVKRFAGGVEALAGLDFGVRAGECFGLLGPNGAGKSTALKAILGLIEPDAGRIRLLGLDIPAQARQARARAGVVPQADALDPDFTVAENLLVFGRYFGLARSVLDARLEPLLEFAGLAHKRDAKIDALSGGMRRRLTLARALVNDPDVLFLDEPTTGLDPQARHLIWERLRQLLARGKTIVLTTHFMEEAERLCNRVAIIDHGRRIALDAPASLVVHEIEPQVVEVNGEGVAHWARAEAPALAARVELVGETAFLYCAGPAAAAAAAAAAGRTASLRVLQRPANLEDVFLKLTGRELRD
ncbi:MAG: ATP-binding cassette domain-containing protein [Burkholderiales bacterium]|nr:ATP-binding cassette domain-containing protein [Burkholderiales bacterium]OJX08920.1 MAG: nodulation factor ABC transporter ATP-binding protein NodI [Burkholderiales bacterium 70-64]